MTTLLNLDPSEVPSDGQVLAYDAASTKWLPVTPSGGGGSAPDASTTVKGVVQLTNHLGGTATAPTVRAASTTQTGIVELATNTEATTGTDTSRAVTPSGVKAVVDARATDYATAAQGTKADAAIPSGLVDAKGDLIVATADNTLTRLPAGTNGHVLTVDSTAAAGVKWAASAGGGGGADTGADEWGMHARRPIPGRWFLPTNMIDGQSPTAAQTAQAHYFPVILVKPITLSEVTTYCWTAVASSGMRVAFYTITPATGKPDALIADIGSFSGETTGAKTIGSLALDLPAAFIVGMYPFGDPRFSKSSFGSFGIYGPTSVTDAESVGVLRAGVDYSAAFPASETPVQCSYARASIMGSQQPSIYLKASALL